MADRGGQISSINRFAQAKKNTYAADLLKIKQMIRIEVLAGFSALPRTQYLSVDVAGHTPSIYSSIPGADLFGVKAGLRLGYPIARGRLQWRG